MTPSLLLLGFIMPQVGRQLSLSRFTGVDQPYRQVLLFVYTAFITPTFITKLEQFKTGTI